MTAEQKAEQQRTPEKDKNFVYPTFGLVGEAGEVAEKIKKVLREKNDPRAS